ncbi:MAG TPA: HEPN domain-containing protein [Terriglobia bacterium]|nr:HEPN domain-containing protein [Terriglobia bacterium]
MPDELALARGWFLKAESDLRTAERMIEGDGPYDTACFHAQQAVEKYLKGLLTFMGAALSPHPQFGRVVASGRSAACLAAGRIGPRRAELLCYRGALRF